MTYSTNRYSLILLGLNDDRGEGYCTNEQCQEGLMEADPREYVKEFSGELQAVLGHLLMRFERPNNGGFPKDQSVRVGGAVLYFHDLGLGAYRHDFRNSLFPCSASPRFSELISP